MSSSFYPNLAATSARLIADKGQVVVFSRVISGTLNPVTGIISGGSNSTTSTNAVALDYNNSEIDGTIIKKGDVKLIAEVTATEPETGDTCTVDSVVYRVMNSKPLKPSGISIINTVQLRK